MAKQTADQAVQCDYCLRRQEDRMQLKGLLLVRLPHQQGQCLLSMFIPSTPLPLRPSQLQPRRPWPLEDVPTRVGHDLVHTPG